MNEFIVWDDIKKEFSNDVQQFISFNCDGTINCFNGFGKTNYFPCIGKTDINDKKIYADCSIVEFIYWYREDLENKRVDEKKMLGYFYYNEDTLCYSFHNIKDGKNYSYGRMDFTENLKIVDTIQENKLGLIKE